MPPGRTDLPEDERLPASIDHYGQTGLLSEGHPILKGRRSAIERGEHRTSKYLNNVAADPVRSSA
jgi:hypothetical protein